MSLVGAVRQLVRAGLRPVGTVGQLRRATAGPAGTVGELPGTVGRLPRPVLQVGEADQHPVEVPRRRAVLDRGADLAEGAARQQSGQVVGGVVVDDLKAPLGRRRLGIGRADQVRREVRRDPQDQVVPAARQPLLRVRLVGAVPAEDVPLRKLVGEILPDGYHLAGGRLHRPVLVHQRDRDPVEVAVRIPERREVQRAVQQRDHRQYHECRGGQPAAQEPAQLEPGQSHRCPSIGYSVAGPATSRQATITAYP